MPTLTPCYDVLIRHAEIIDGTGSARFDGDLAIDGARIVRLGDLSHAQGRLEIDARGLVLAPGFIDAHTHDDRVMLSAGDMTPKVSQGVTTIIGGNCGISLAPMPQPAPAVMTPPLDLLDQTGQWYRYATFGDYLAALRAQPAATNCAMLVGHSTLRVITMDDLGRPAHASEIARMRAHVEEALAAGAIGVSTGLAYAPALAASTEEVIDICRPLADYAGLYCTHMRDEGDDVMASLEETFRIGRELGVPVVISHHKVVGVQNHGRSEQTLARIRAAMAQQPVCLDCYPYTASSTILNPQNVAKASRTTVTWSKSLPQYTGRDLDDITRELGCTQAEAIARLQPAGAIYFNMNDADVARILQFEDTMIGSDGLPHDERPHPRLWGTFPRVLGHYSRGLGLFPLEKAIHKMTGLTANRYGLVDRGVIREGAYADLALFNADTIAAGATFEQPMTPAIGMDTVLVNGAVAWRDGKPGGARSGRVLRREVR